MTLNATVWDLEKRRDIWQSNKAGGTPLKLVSLP